LVTFDERSEQVKNQWMVLVDVIGEIERERHPLHVLTVAPDGSQTTPAMAQRLVECLPSDLAHGARVISLHVDRRALVLKNRYGRVGHWFETMQEIPPPPEEGLGPEPGILAPRVTDLARAHLRPEHPRDHIEPAADTCASCSETLGSPSPCAITHDFGPGAYPAPKDEATALAYGTWDPERPGVRITRGDRSDEEMREAGRAALATMAEPWSPKPGGRVRTVDPLTGCALYGKSEQARRRPGVAGAIWLRGNPTLGDWWIVRHDDGTEAPYDESELRPEPGTKGGV
jgi:hypothetical protein